MPIKIEQYGGQKFSTQVAPSAKAPDLPPISTAIAQGISDVGTALTKIADDISTTEAEDALVRFEREKNSLFYDPEGGYFNTQGRDAFDLSGDVKGQLEKLQKNYSGSLSGPAQRKFNSVARNHVTKGLVNIQKHAFAGYKAWEIATIKSTVENAIENVALNWNDLKNVSLNLKLGRQGVRDAATLEGISGEALNERLQNFDAAVAEAAITSATADSAEAGKKAIGLYGDLLEGSTKAVMTNKIKIKSRQEKQRDDAVAAVAISDNMLNQHDTLTEMQEAVREKTKNDPELMGKALKELQTQFFHKRAAERDERAADFDEFSKRIKDETAAQIQASDQQRWDNLDATQQRILESGKPVVTDMAKYIEFTLLSEPEQARVDPNKYLPYFAPVELKEVAKKIAAARKGDNIPGQLFGRTDAQQVVAAAEKVLDKKKKDWGKEDTIKANTLYGLFTTALVVDKQRLGRELNFSESTEVFRKITRDYINERGTELSLDEEILSEFSQEDIDFMINIIISEGRPVTVKELIITSKSNAFTKTNFQPGAYRVPLNERR